MYVTILVIIVKFKASTLPTTPLRWNPTQDPTTCNNPTNWEWFSFA